MIQSFRTDMPGQTVQTQIRRLLQGLHCLPFCLQPTHYSMVEPHSSNFRVITTNFVGVRIFRKFTVVCENHTIFYKRTWLKTTLMNSPLSQQVCLQKNPSPLKSGSNLVSDYIWHLPVYWIALFFSFFFSFLSIPVFIMLLLHFFWESFYTLSRLFHSYRAKQSKWGT